MEEKLVMGGEVYEHVRSQRNGAKVYRGKNTFLRVGPSQVIRRHLALQKELLARGFRFAEIVEEGEMNGLAFFRERSLGDIRFNDMFAEETEYAGNASDAHFDAFLALVMEFTRTQARTYVVERAPERFAQGIHLDILCGEMPAHAEKIRALFEEALARTAHVPFVFTHGDLNPANMFPNGIIDLEDTFSGPLGYDAVTALKTVEWFPDSPEYEYFTKYRFSEAQKKRYMDMMDALFNDMGLSPLSEILYHLEFCRAVWMTVRMHEWPRLQHYRYERFKKTYLVPAANTT